MVLSFSFEHQSKFHKSRQKYVPLDFAENIKRQVLGIVFRNGSLFVEKEKTTLQKLLSLHPFKDKIFYEHNPVKEAAQDIEILELEADAIVIAKVTSRADKGLVKRS